MNRSLHARIVRRSYRVFVVYLYGLHRGQIFIEGGGDSLVAMHGLPGVNLLIGSRRELFVDVQVLPHGERLVCWSIIL